MVRAGPSDLIDHEVFGSGGDLGITRDGTHAHRLVLPDPATMTLAEAGALGVPFITAQEGFRRAGFPRQAEVVLVMGGNGRVGQAAVQIAAMRWTRCSRGRANTWRGRPLSPSTARSTRWGIFSR